MNEEIWCDIKNYEGLYQVSNKGKVKSLNYKRTGKEKILRPGKNGKGYLFVRLYKNRETKMYKVHRLVLSTFSPCPDSESLQVNHINECKADNRLENLEWVTNKDNQNHGTRNARMAEKKSIPIVQLALDGKYIKSYRSAIEAKRECGFNNGNIIQCCKNKYLREGNNIYRGFKWMYLSEFLDKNNGLLID